MYTGLSGTNVGRAVTLPFTMNAWFTGLAKEVGAKLVMQYILVDRRTG